MRCLLLIDVQNDFLPAGALAVPEGDAIVPVINTLIDRFELVVATQDWHPPGHCSFADNHPGRRVGEVIEVNGVEQILWPRHCVEDTEGAAFARGLDLSCIQQVIQKGTDHHVDSYSGFFDNQRLHATALNDYLRMQGVRELYVAGLATDYCVKFTVLDALDLGFNTWLIEDACRGVEHSSGDAPAAIDAMQAAGAHFVHSSAIAQ